MRVHFCFVVLGLVVSLSAFSQTLFQKYERFIAAYSEKRFGECVQNGKQLALETRNPGIVYWLAHCYSRMDSLQASVSLLDSLAAWGLTYDIGSNENLQPLKRHTSFARLLASFEANRKPVETSMRAFSLSDKTLIPEGIAVSQEGAFYIGSLAQHKVVRYDSLHGEVDFLASGKGGIWSVLGLRVSPEGKSLWLCSATERDSINGYAGLFQFALPGGELLRKYTVDNHNGAHLFNDLVLSKTGQVYFTDSKGGAILSVSPERDSIETLLDQGFIYPNGIAFNAEESALFIADFAGIKRIDLKTKKVVQLATGGRTFLNGIDGLYFYQGSLIAIQNSGNMDHRIVRFYLERSETAVALTKVLQSYRPDFASPTTGTIWNGAFYYIANSHLRNLQPNGGLVKQDQLQPTRVLRLPLK